jgi:hypothetical protein
MPLYRHYEKVTPLHWQDENHFVGTVDRAHPRLEPATYACYGWSKGAGFFIYIISDGHIEKLGSIKREELL